MNPEKIVKVEKDEVKPPFSHGLVHVTFEDANGMQYRADMSEKQWEAQKLYEEFKKRGYDLKLIEEFLDAYNSYRDEFRYGCGCC